MLLKTFENVGLGEAQDLSEDLISDWDEEYENFMDDHEDDECIFESKTLPGLGEDDEVVLMSEDGLEKYLFTDEWELYDEEDMSVTEDEDEDVMDPFDKDEDEDEDLEDEEGEEE